VLLAAGLVWPLQGAEAAQAGRLVVIVMENERYGDIVGNSAAPYLNQLIGRGKLFTDYAAVASGSNSNYLAMTSGLTARQSPPAANIFGASTGRAGCRGGSSWSRRRATARRGPAPASRARRSRCIRPIMTRRIPTGRRSPAAPTTCR
jgi:hypothetical protein